MSANYHAFQSRNVLFADSEAGSQQWWDRFAGYDPGRVSGILHLKTDESYVYIRYFHTWYRMNLENGHLEKEEDGQWTQRLYVNETMAIYHLFEYVKDQPVVSGQWVPGYSLYGGAARNTSQNDPLFAAFSARFQGRMAELIQACEKLGGKKLSKGDVGYQFEAFERVELQLYFWEADEDFPAQVQVLVDSTITDFLYCGTIGCLISDLFEKLIRCADAQDIQ